MRVVLIAAISIALLTTNAGAKNVTQNRAEGVDTHRRAVESQQARPAAVFRSGSDVASSAPIACRSWHSHIEPTMSQTKIHNRVLWLIRCAVSRWPVPGGYPMARCIAERESGPYTSPWAYNPSGSSGVFQITGGTWESWRFNLFATRAQMHRLATSVFNARANVLVAVWAMNAGGLGPWSGGCA